MISLRKPLALRQVLNSLGLLLVAFECGPTAAQNAQFKATARASVPLFATVRDTAGRLVSGLPKDTFSVNDNGVPQELTLFDNTPVPIALVVLLDSSTSMVGSIGRVRDATLKLVASLAPLDVVELGSFNHLIKFARPFSSDRDITLRALAYYGPVDFGTAIWEGIGQAMLELKDRRERKVILVLTDGEDNLSGARVDGIMSRVIASDVMTYAVTIDTEYVYRGKKQHSQIDRRLQTFAQETGGACFALKPDENLAATFGAISEELHSQYLLAFEPTILDGKKHHIDINVTGEGLRATSRESYIAKPLHD